MSIKMEPFAANIRIQKNLYKAFQILMHSVSFKNISNSYAILNFLGDFTNFYVPNSHDLLYNNKGPNLDFGNVGIQSNLSIS